MSIPRGKELTAMALWSWSNLYHHSIASVVDADAATAFEKMAHDCIESLPELMVLDFTEHPLARPSTSFAHCPTASEAESNPRYDDVASRLRALLRIACCRDHQDPKARAARARAR